MSLCLTFRNATEWLNLFQRPFLTEGLKIKPLGFPQHQLPVIFAQRLSRQWKDKGLHEKQPLARLRSLSSASPPLHIENGFSFGLALFLFFLLCFVSSVICCGKNTSQDIHPPT